MMLTAILHALAEPAKAWIGVRTSDRWERTAGDGELRLDLDEGGSMRVSGRVLVGRFDTDSGVRVGLRIEMLSDAELRAAATTFKVGLDVVAAYEAVREERLRTQSFQEQTQRLLDLATALSSNLYSDETFFSELLRAAMTMIPEADAGSMAQLKDGVWRFIAAQGHDEAGLKDLSMPAGAMRIHPEPVIIDALLDGEPGTVPGIRQRLAAVSLPIAKTLIVTLDAGPGHWVNAALDISDARRRFSPASQEVFSRLTGLVRSFLAFRSQKAAVDKANRRLTEKLALLAEAHDIGTAEHNARVATIAALLAARLGLAPELVEAIREGAVLHDIGKLFLDPTILNKNAPLSVEERARVYEHTTWAGKLLDDPYFAVDQKIAVSHHERFDGRGYPRGLKGDEIPIEAQIVSVADVYDALRSPRPYKSGLSSEEALRRMTEGDDRTPAGAFNPVILETLRACASEIEALWSVTPES